MLPAIHEYLVQEEYKFVSIVAHDSTLSALNAMLFNDFVTQPDYADFVAFQVIENELKILVKHRSLIVERSMSMAEFVEKRDKFTLRT